MELTVSVYLWCSYIHAVKLAQHASILEKRIGYLAVSVLLHEDHELMLLLVNTMQRDLKSTNVVEICTALTAMARVMNAEMIPAVLPLVEKLASHGREIVRKKVRFFFFL
jgi:AP-4 complex subunit epsilon-1